MQPNGVFHLKLYFFQTGADWEAIVGSSNMTNGGLPNSEMNVHIYRQDDTDGAAFNRLSHQLRNIMTWVLVSCTTHAVHDKSVNRH